MAKQAQNVASPAVTLTPEALQAVIAQAIAEHEQAKAQKASADTTAEMDKIVVRNFAKAGFKNVQPRIDTLVYGKWIEQGRRVRPGETAVKCRNLRLFHISQTDPLNPVEAKKAL